MAQAGNILVITKGHPFDRNAFFAMLEALEAQRGLGFTHVEQPAAQLFFDPALAAPYDAFLIYDMPGYAFDPPNGVSLLAAPDALRSGFDALTRAGKGLVFLHHALAGWPDWPDYGAAIGGRFLYRPGPIRGQVCADSGYRHDVAYSAEVVRAHPITAGLPMRFDVLDELYLAEVFEDDIEVLVRARHAFVEDNFHSAEQAVHGRMFSNEGWHHPPGSDAIVWAKHWQASPVAYIQCGDGPSVYENAAVRTLIGNALEWAGGAEGRHWVQERTGE